MKIGMKTGPRTWDQTRQFILDNDVRYLELWYRVDWEERYSDIFAFVKQHNINIGLHFWGVVDGGVLPSFCHDEMSQYRQGLALVKKCVDVAARVGASYVNIHPGSRMLTQLKDYRFLTILDRPLTPEDVSLALLREAAEELHGYAHSRGVLMLFETVPAHDASDWQEGVEPEVLETHHASIDMLQVLADEGYYIANDIGHTTANRLAQDRVSMWNMLYQDTLRLAAQTRLLHISLLSGPNRGVDTHDGVLASDWERDVFPTEKQLIELLTIFKDRDDVWVIPEPQENLMSENYLALRRYNEGVL